MDSTGVTMKLFLLIAAVFAVYADGGKLKEEFLNNDKAFRYGYSFGGKGQIRIDDQDSKMACVMACFNKKLDGHSDINSVDYGVPWKYSAKRCYCNLGSTRVTHSENWVTSLLEDLVKDRFRSGHRVGGKGQIRIDDQDSKMACLNACFDKKINGNSLINSVDYGIPGRYSAKRCYCNLGSTHKRPSANWVTSPI